MILLRYYMLHKFFDFQYYFSSSLTLFVTLNIFKFGNAWYMDCKLKKIPQSSVIIIQLLSVFCQIVRWNLKTTMNIGICEYLNLKKGNKLYTRPQTWAWSATPSWRRCTPSSRSTARRSTDSSFR